jgi:uncharacterized protein (TIGR02302 family)
MTRDWRELLRLRRLITRRLALSRLSLAAERLMTAVWTPLMIVAGFAAVALFDLLPVLPTVVHGVVLVAFAAAAALTVRTGFEDFRWPSALEARHRLETSSGIDHRPLTAWEDNLSYKADRGQNRLWLAHRLRMRDLIEKLRSPLPAAVVAARDPYAVRGLLVLLCTFGLFSAQGDIAPRFVRALNPSVAGETSVLDVKVWITPPAYTQRAPVLLDPSAAEADAPPEPIAAPAGSHILAVVTGTQRTVRLVIDETSVDFSTMDDASQRYEGPLPAGLDLSIRQTGRVLGRWTLKPIADLPPVIAIVEPPEESGRFRVRVKYAAEDDYGIAAVTGAIDRPAETRSYARHWASTFSVATPPLTPKTLEQQSFQDFTAHPWAGKTVTMTLSARDAAGQQSVSDPIEFELPERVFTHPVAATIIQYRKDLIEDPATAPLAARALSRLSEVPSAYGGDVIAHLAMVTARSRLQLQDPYEELDGVLDLMWQAALRMEDGALAAAEQALNDAEDALTEAIENGASPEQINQRIAQLQRALMDYYEALAEKMPDGNFPMMDPNNAMQSMGAQDLAQMMEQLSQLSEMGAEDAAREMLSELRNMLDMLRNASLNPQSNPDMEAARQMMDDLQRITQEQSDMLNETFERARQRTLERESSGRPDGNRANRRDSARQQSSERDAGEKNSDRDTGEQAAEEQDELRRRLGDLMGRMAEMTGQVPEDLGDAEQAMREAEEALLEEAFRSASESQGEALAKLQSGMQGAAQQMMQALAEKGMAGLIPIPGQSGLPFGALGQNLGPDQGEETELPTQPDTRGLSQRSREILEEIRKRAGQRLRPRDERQYLRRLLDQF